MRKVSGLGFVPLLAVCVLCGWTGIAGAAAGDAIVASVNGEGISVRELRESLGLVGGGVPASWVPVEKKREALDRLIDARLLERSARARGMDNTAEFRELVARNAPNLAAFALLRREAAAKVSLPKAEIRAEMDNIRKTQKDLSETDARKRASAVVFERNLRRVEAEVIAAARKDASAEIDEGAISRIGKAGSTEDNAVLGTAGGEAVRYGDVKTLLGRAAGGKHGSADLSVNPSAVRNLVDRELTRRSLLQSARKQGAADPEWEAGVRKETERIVLVSLLTDNVIGSKVTVTEKEIADAYARHSGMLVRGGKPVPLSEVREQIRGIVLAEKRNAATANYIARLRKNAKIRIDGKLLPKV